MKPPLFVVPHSGKATPEEKAALAFYRLDTGRNGRSSRFSDLPSLIRRHPPSALWWHYDASIDLPSEACTPEFLSVIRNYVAGGGGLLLSLLAAQYVSRLGIESIPPSKIIKGAWDEECWAPGYPDIRGIASMRGHPLFTGLGNAVYTWSAVRGQPYAGAWHADGVRPNEGKVVGVERQYIRLADDRCVAVEYRLGKGTILTIGTHFFFAHQDRRYRPHLERLAENALGYVSGERLKGKRTYWTFAQQPPQQIIPRIPIIKWRGVGGALAEPTPPIFRANLTDNEFDLGGERILILGKESAGISEVWVHPCRILRDLRVSFGVGGSEPVQAETLRGEVEQRFECMTRRYRTGGAEIEEIVFGDHILPAGALTYTIDSPEPVRIALRTRVDLRLMWPLPSSATGTLSYGWDERLGALLVTDQSGEFVSLTGSRKRPETQRISTVKDGSWNVVLDLEYVVQPGDDPLTMVFAGSHIGMREVAAAYQRMSANPAGRRSLHARRYKSIVEESTIIEGPDPEFNRGYIRALTSTMRFAVQVPGIGASLMAGYADTAHGWNGGRSVSGRPGYAWFFGRDSIWTSFALLACGQAEIVRDVLTFLGDHQDLSGKILHEMTTSGFIHYDAADASPLFIILMGRYLAATGDTRFIREHYSQLRLALDFCRSTDSDRDGLIENTGVGHGWVEGGALFPVHKELYLAASWGEALAQASFVAERLRDLSHARRLRKEADRVRRSIRKSFWNDAGKYYSFGKNIDGTFRTDETALQSVGVMFGATEESRDELVLDALASSRFSADWGVRLVPHTASRYDPAGYHSGSIWPLMTGWVALAEFARDRPVQGFTHLMSNALLSEHWSAGNFPEVLRGDSFVPAGVCQHQAWSSSMVLQPLLEGMLGLRPDASARRIALRPYFPPDWERAEVRDIRVGNDVVNMTMRRRMNRTSFIFSTTASRALTIDFQPWLPCGTTLHAVRAGSSVMLRDISIARHADVPPLSFRLKGTLRITYEHSGGVAIIPPAVHPQPGASSSGLRIIREEWKRDSYVIAVEGKEGGRATIDLIAGRKLVSVEGARIVRDDGERLMLEIAFGGRDDYVRKDVRCLFE